MLTKAQINRMKKDITDEAVRKAVVLFLGYIMEDPAINCDEAKIAEIFEGVSRYAEAVDDHLITLKQVAKIIEEHTGIVIRW